MTKRELSDAVMNAANSNLGSAGFVERKEADAVVDALVGVIHKEVKAGRDVRIPDLGRFYRQSRKRRKGRNPQTGESITIPAKKAAKFTAAKAFKDLVG